MICPRKSAAQHSACIREHRNKIKALHKSGTFEKLSPEITSPRMERLDRFYTHFGANVFLGGTETAPYGEVFKTIQTTFSSPSSVKTSGT